MNKSKNWFNKDISELRREKEKQVEKRNKLEKHADERRRKELVEKKKQCDDKLNKLKAAKPESTVKETFDLKIWMRGGGTSWLFTNLTKAEITKIGDDIYACEGHIRISDRGFINLEHVLVVRVVRKLG